MSLAATAVADLFFGRLGQLRSRSIAVCRLIEQAALIGRLDESLAPAAEQKALEEFQFCLELFDLRPLLFARNGGFREDTSCMKQLALTSFQVIGQ
jgi:hypothetical protein